MEWKLKIEVAFLTRGGFGHVDSQERSYIVPLWIKELNEVKNAQQVASEKYEGVLEQITQDAKEQLIWKIEIRKVQIFWEMDLNPTTKEIIIR
jgi:hypothetical protein